MAPKPVFFDASGKRSRGIAVIAWIAAIIFTILAGAFIASLVVAPPLSRVPLHERMSALPMRELERKAVAPRLLRNADRLAAEIRQRRIRLARAAQQRSARTGPSATTLQPRGDRPLTIAFYPNWDPEAFAGLKRVLPHLDWLVPTWLTVQGPDMALKSGFDQATFNYVRARRPGMAILPTLQNAAMGKWDGEGLARNMADPAWRAKLVDQLTAFLAAHQLDGVTIDFENVPPSAYDDTASFLSALNIAFAPHHWTIAITAPYDDDTWPFARYAALTDYTMLMAYDEHFTGSEAGSVAGQPWFEDYLDKRMRVLAPSRTIVAIGSYGYDWIDGAKTADAVSFEAATAAARAAGATIQFDEATNNPHFSYLEDGDTRHDIWFLDGVTAFNQIHAADIYRPAGYAVWRIGTEDSSVWPVMGRPYGAGAPDALHTIENTTDIGTQGSGEIFRIAADPTPGARQFDVEKDNGDIIDERYTTLPTGFVIRQYGAAQGKVALTFDDGPDAEWTPQILDILKREKVKATFFIIGENAQANPGLVQRILDEGHDIGNHTFTHPNLAETGDHVTALELNANQRLFQALTGRSMRLFRPPYIGDAEPTDAAEIYPVEVAQGQGYITVGQHVDPSDWQRPGVDAIVRDTVEQVKQSNDALSTNIILLHDSGGDRSQTVTALPLIIHALRARGYQFTQVAALAGLTRDQVMPPLKSTLALQTDRVVFLGMGYLGTLFYYCFLGAIILGLLRLVFMAAMSFAGRANDRRARLPAPAIQPFTVTVLIPAYNEEKVIAGTVDRILRSNFASLQVLVIDDGSKDRTLEVLQQRYGANPQVDILALENGGKAHALNAGLAHRSVGERRSDRQKTSGDIVVALDADTLFNTDTIARLVRWFEDPAVGAVAGNAKVGNRINMVTRWQAIEYVVAQNLERRALAALGTLTVVPGAVGAWRRAALEAVGGFPSDTLAEDQDLTIALQRAGYDIGFDTSAIAWTEAPATFRALAKQRFRWSFGTLQCLWKYRSMLLRPRYGALGMVALPQVWLFQILLTALAPFADLLLIWQLAAQLMAYLQHGSEFSPASLWVILTYYGVFMAVDLAAAMVGFLAERGEDWRLLWSLPLQRFGYRQLMYYVVVRSILTALRGPFVGWGKLDRSGTVSAAQGG